MSLIAELKRRNVFRVAAAYVVLSWLLLQIGDILFEALSLPDWSIKMLVALLGLGLIPALIFSWAYELTPEGVKKESEVDRSGSVTPYTGRKLNFITIGMIALGIGVVVVDRLVLDRDDTGRSEPAVADATPQIKPLTAVAPNGSVSPDDRSIAVLPFLNLSSDKEQEYFSDGLADTLLHRLAQLPDLRVAARTSSFKFKGKNEDMRDIARQLGVATVLEGSVQKSGNRVRITAQLIRGDDGSHIWSKVFDDTLDDIFRVQDEIARSVAEALTATWLTDAEQGPARRGTTDLDAYDAYLKGLKGLDQGTPEGASNALAQLELAVELDPGYALAWVALSEAYLGPAQLGTATWESTFEPRMKAATKALDLAPGMAEAHLAMANVLWQRGSDPVDVRSAVEKAVTLSPNNASALEAMGELMGDEGAMRDALRLTERAVLINPLDQDLQVTLAMRRMNIGLVQSALELGAEVVANNPDNLDLLMDYGDLLRMAGRPPVEWARIFRQALKRSPDLLRALFRLHFLYLEFGDPQSADHYLRRVEVLSPNRALDDRAEACLLSGDRDCHRDYAARYIKLQRDAGANSSADLYEGVLQIYLGDYQQAVALLEPRLEGQITANMAFDLNGSLYLALAYGRAGMLDKRDALLNLAEDNIRTALANGLWTRFAAQGLLELAAIRGDAGLAAERLGIAIDIHAAPPSNELENYAFYDAVRDDSGFQEQLAKRRQYETGIRQQLSELTP